MEHTNILNCNDVQLRGCGRSASCGATHIGAMRVCNWIVGQLREHLCADKVSATSII